MMLMSGAIESWALVQHIKQKEKGPRLEIKQSTGLVLIILHSPVHSYLNLESAVWKVIEEGLHSVAT